MKRIVVFIFLLSVLYVKGFALIWDNKNVVVDKESGTSLDINSDGSANVRISSSAESNYTSAQSTRTTNAFTFYVVGGSTTTAVTYVRLVSSMGITSTAGLYPGTTWLVYADTNKDTIEEFVTYLNAVPVTTLGAEGGIVAAINDKCYEGNYTSKISSNVTATNCHSSTHTVTVGLDNVFGIIEKLSAPSSGKAYYVTDVEVNATFGSGITKLYIRDGTADDSTLKYRQIIGTTIVDEWMDSSLVVGSVNTALRFEVLGSSWVSAGDFFYTIYQK